MSAYINNLDQVNAYTIYGALKSYSRNVKKLSSGSRLNKAGDGAAEIAVSNLLKADLVTIDQGIRNIRNGISILHTADSSLETVSRNLTRMKELASQAASDVYSPEQKRLMQQELDQLDSQNTQIGQMTNFNGIRLHKDNQTISITGDGQEVTSIHTKSLPAVSASLSDFKTAVYAVEHSINYVNAYRASLGNCMAALEQGVNSLEKKAEEILKSESRIADINVATAAALSASGELLTQQAVALQAHTKTISEIAGALL